MYSLSWAYDDPNDPVHQVVGSLQTLKAIKHLLDISSYKLVYCEIRDLYGMLLE